MSSQCYLLPAHKSLHNWIWGEKDNRLFLIASGIILLTQVIVFKIQYPYPNFISESTTYLVGAYNNQDINVRPIAYSKFLRLLSAFTSSHLVLFLLQYLVLQGSIFYLLFSIKYLLNPSKWAFGILICLSSVNFLPLYISNLVSSDALFTSLSIIWITHLLWIPHFPNTRLLLTHAIILVLAFMMNYNAWYYTIISMALIILQPSNLLKSKLKIISVTCTFLLLGIFVGLTKYQFYASTGTTQFDPLRGWQLSNNSLYAYVNVRPEEHREVPVYIQSLHKTINRYLDSVNYVADKRNAELKEGDVWNKYSPLRAYMHDFCSKDTNPDSFKQWALMGPLYSKYGGWIIRHYPISFIRFYLKPNLVNYVLPPVESLEKYNMGKKTIDSVATIWFQLKNKSIHTYNMDSQKSISNYYPIILSLTTAVFILSLILFNLVSGFTKLSSYKRKVIQWVPSILLVHMAFTVYYSPIVLRYQLFPLVITYTFGVLLLGYIYQITQKVKLD